MFNNYPDIVTVQDLCKMINIGRNNAYELIRCGEIQSIKIGRQIRISKQSIIDFINKDKKF